MVREQRVQHVEELLASRRGASSVAGEGAQGSSDRAAHRCIMRCGIAHCARAAARRPLAARLSSNAIEPSTSPARLLARRDRIRAASLRHAATRSGLSARPRSGSPRIRPPDQLLALRKVPRLRRRVGAARPRPWSSRRSWCSMAGAFADRAAGAGRGRDRGHGTRREAAGASVRWRDRARAAGPARRRARARAGRRLECRGGLQVEQRLVGAQRRAPPVRDRQIRPGASAQCTASARRGAARRSVARSALPDRGRGSNCAQRASAAAHPRRVYRCSYPAGHAGCRRRSCSRAGAAHASTAPGARAIFTSPGRRAAPCRSWPAAAVRRGRHGARCHRRRRCSGSLRLRRRGSPSRIAVSALGPATGSSACRIGVRAAPSPPRRPRRTARLRPGPRCARRGTPTPRRRRSRRVGKTGVERVASARMPARFRTQAVRRQPVLPAWPRLQPSGSWLLTAAPPSTASARSAETHAVFERPAQRPLPAELREPVEHGTRRIVGDVRKQRDQRFERRIADARPIRPSASGRSLRPAAASATAHRAPRAPRARSRGPGMDAEQVDFWPAWSVSPASSAGQPLLVAAGPVNIQPSRSRATVSMYPRQTSVRVLHRILITALDARRPVGGAQAAVAGARRARNRGRRPRSPLPVDSDGRALSQVRPSNVWAGAQFCGRS